MEGSCYAQKAESPSLCCSGGRVAESCACRSLTTTPLILSSNSLFPGNAVSEALLNVLVSAAISLTRHAQGSE